MDAAGDGGADHALNFIQAVRDRRPDALHAPIGEGHFSPGEPGLFRPLVDGLLNHDPFLLLADYRSYVECQERVSRTYLDAEQWTRRSILNTANMGYFSSDRTILEYAEDIWGVTPMK